MNRIGLYRRNWRDVIFLPVAILWGWLHGVIKLHGLVSLHQVSSCSVQQRDMATYAETLAGRKGVDTGVGLRASRGTRMRQRWAKDLAARVLD